MNKKINIFILLFGLISSISFGQTCGSKKYCKDILGEGFDYRGQSTYGRLLPGDTSRVKVVLYSKNIVRIMACGEEGSPVVDFKVLKSIREYNRVIDRVEKTSIDEPIYAVDENGDYVQKYNDWGEPEYDEYGDPVFEVKDYKTITKSDTIWKTERVEREEVIFDSKTSSQKYFEEAVKTTRSVIIEVVMPKSDAKTESCVAIMIGRKFFSNSYNKFSPNN